MNNQRKLPARVLFFPAAGLYAAVLVPLSLWALFYRPLLLPGINGGLDHARELLFGFALAVIAGYLLGPLSLQRLMTLFGLWLGARLGYLLAPESFLPPLIGSLFALGLAMHIVPRFHSAKKWRNRLLSPLLLSICLLASVLFWLIHTGKAPGLQHALVYQAVLLLALLMLFMGGRVIAPALAGHYQRLGEILNARVQPRLEGWLILSTILAIVLMSWPASRSWAGPVLILAGALAFVRLLRWRLWWCGKRPDLLCLGVGYGWLAVGLVSNGIAQWQQQMTSSLIHVITLGALGTLTGVIMMRSTILQAGGRDTADLAREWRIPVFTVLIAVATLLRLAAPHVVSLHLALLWSASLAWCLAWLLATWCLCRATSDGLKRQAARHREAQ
ncbi:NnrS family protein [Halomonas sp. M20]|uniref:NnrS family protein n=1 Tax=Halomonas sp. M20 TaxID=2763264 RepID=UPI001D0A395B|nr:NnrS family protein [Halomonas sp. M20]